MKEKKNGYFSMISKLFCLSVLTTTLSCEEVDSIYEQEEDPSLELFASGNSCETAIEDSTARLDCGSGTITSIRFASYGTPEGSCSSGYNTSSCHASSSISKVEDFCLNRSSCAVPADNDVFGDPCKGTKKRLYVQYACDGNNSDDGNGSGGDEGGQSVVIQENSTGYCSADGKVETEHSGYSGAGFVNVDNAMRSGIEWNIEGNSGTYSFKWRYANGSASRPARLIVDGREVAAKINFDTTGSWKNWGEASVNVTLNSQVKRIRLEALEQNGLANIDYIKITGPGVKAVGCQTTPAAGVVGFATQNGGTTGGAGGENVTVSNATAFLNAIGNNKPLTINVNGKISLSGMHKVTSNKTIRGVGENGVISGGGLNISRVSNVIIQNLLFTGSNDDAINVEYSKNVWIDHCDLNDAYDGLVDIKRASDFITVSWNHFTNHEKTCLLGHSDSNGSEDNGHLRVTYHHNWFDHTSSRHPRVRFSELTHVYNNYYDDNGSYGIASTENAEVLVEANYFYEVARPTLIGYGSSGSGDLVQKNNIFKSSGSPKTRNSVPNPPYSYRLDDASLIPSIVKNGAGRAGFHK